MIFWLLLAAANQACAAFYDFTIVAQGGQEGLVSINKNVSINDSGLVAFAATSANGTSVYVGDGASTPIRSVTTLPTGGGVDPCLEINNAGMVVAERGPFAPVTSDPVIYYDPILGPIVVYPGTSDIFSFVQLWDANNPGNQQLVAQADWELLNYVYYTDYTKVGPFSYLGPAVSVNNLGGTAFVADTGVGFNSSYVLASPNAANGYNTVSCWLGAQPKMADNGLIVLRNGPNDTDSIIVYDSHLSAPQVVASAAQGFTALGRSPGISDDGRYIAFYGELNAVGATSLHTIPGPGIFLAGPLGAGSSLRRIAGLVAADGTPQFSAFDGSSPVGVNVQAANGSVLVVFAAGSPAGQAGIAYTIFNPSSGSAATTAHLVQQGDALGTAGVAEGFQLFDPVNAKGQVAFWAQTDGGTVVAKCSLKIVQVVALEVTQVIQDWSNSIPLIQGKETYVRVHLQLPAKNLPAVTVSGARLYGTKPDGSALPDSPQSPLSIPGESLKVQTANAADPDVRGHLINSMNFRLPPAWTAAGPIALRFSWPGGMDPANVTSNDCTVSLPASAFVASAVPQIKFFAANWTDADGIEHTVDQDRDINSDLAQRIQSCYPVAKVDATFGTVWSWLLGSGQPGIDWVNGWLVAARYYDSLPWNSPAGNRIYHGVIPVPSQPSGTIGRAVDTPSFVSSSLFWSPYGPTCQTASHELGHNLGRCHDVNETLFETKTYPDGKVVALGANPDPPEEGPVGWDYPLFEPFDTYPKGAPTLEYMTKGDNALVYGLDSRTLALKTAGKTQNEPVVSPTNMAYFSEGPNCYFDLMSYCRKRGPEDVWPSFVTYTALLSSIRRTFSASAAGTQGGPRPQGLATYLIARGEVDFNAGTAQFLPCLTFTTTAEPPVPAGTNSLLSALDGSGAVVQAIPFGLEPGIVEENDTNRVATFIVPVPSDPRIQELRLEYQGKVMATLKASPHGPKVTLTAPHGGQIFATGAVSVAWSASHPDAAPLTYTVQYSADGGATWETVAVDWPGMSLELESQQLKATTNGLVRVIASDGFNSQMSQSPTNFTVQPHPPMVGILAPLDGATFIGDVQVFLDANANDPQDGALGGTNVQWSSNLDGSLGQGAVVTFSATRLTEGFQTITVTAIDSAGLTNSATTHLWVSRSARPQLSIRWSATPPSVTLSWPVASTNYMLQGSASLTAGWTAITNTPSAAGDQQSVSVGIPGSRRFFRLILHP